MGPSPAVAEARRAVRRSFAAAPALTAGQRVLVACSGGADSLTLAAAVAFEAPRAGLLAGGVTVDHGLQDGSAERASAVVETMARLGLEPSLRRRADVPRDGGPEGAARAARYGALEAAAAHTDAAAVLLGHSRDDQAETVLLGLARGSGARSLAAMAAVRGPWRRPFLDIERSALRAACRDAGLEPWDDPHNADPAFARARMRHAVLPLLEVELGPGVSAALARTARLLRADADALDTLAAAELTSAARPDGLAVADLQLLPTALRTRVLRLAAIDAGCPATRLSAGHVEALDALVTAWRGQAHVDLPGRVVGRRACGRLLLARSAEEQETSP